MTKSAPQDAWKRALLTLQAETEALGGLAKHKDRFLQALAILSSCRGTILVSGTGKSAHVGEKIAATLTSLGHRAIFLDPNHALHGDVGFVSNGDVLLAISFSGRSPEILKLARHLKKEFSVAVVALTGASSSSLSTIADAVLPINIRSEGSPLNLAPMASTTATLALGDMLASALTDPESFEKKHFARFHPAGNLGLETKKVEACMQKAMPLVREADTFSHSLAVITKYKKGIVGVVNERGTLVGAITDGDVRRFVMKHSDTKTARAKDAMSKKPKSIPFDATLSEALEKMETYKITSLFVSRTEKPIGIIHMHDIVETI